MTKIIKLPIVGEDAKGFEDIPVAPVGATSFRLLNSPGFVHGVALGDTIELADTPTGFRVIRRSGNVCVWVTSDAPMDDQLSGRVMQIVVSGGGVVDGGYKDRLIVANFRLSTVGFSAIEKCMSQVERIPTLSWMYGNIYDPMSGAPLEWW